MVIEAGAPGAAGTASGDAPWSDIGPHPIRRWIARTFDAYVTTGLVLAALVTPWVVLAPPSARTLPILIALTAYLVPPVRGAIAAVLNAAMLSRFSTTPGKRLCGIRIVRQDGAPPILRVAMKRELEALIAGCAVYIPFIAAYAMRASLLDLRASGATSWDQARELRAVQRPDGAAQFVLALTVFLIAAAFAISAVIVALLVWNAAKSGATG